MVTPEEMKNELAKVQQMEAVQRMMTKMDDALEEKPVVKYTADNPLQPVELQYRPDLQADEGTIRAREAIIATGVFPGAEEIIRAGLLDHTHGIQSALEVQRTALVPVSDLAKFPHHPQRQLVPKDDRQMVVDISYRANFWQNLGHWMRRLQHNWMRLRVRYTKTHARALAAEKRVAELEHNLNLFRQSIDAYQQGTWINGVAVGTDVLITNNHLHAQNKMMVNDALMACKTVEERDALMELLRCSVASRLIDKNTDEIVLQMRVPRHTGPRRCFNCGSFVKRIPTNEVEGYCPSCGIKQVVCDGWTSVTTGTPVTLTNDAVTNTSGWLPAPSGGGGGGSAANTNDLYIRDVGGDKRWETSDGHTFNSYEIARGHAQRLREARDDHKKRLEKAVSASNKRLHGKGLLG
jgi:hypothetical protein